VARPAGGTTTAPTIRTRIRRELPRLAPAERRVAGVLLSGDPLAPLDPVSVLAERSGTSAPTVLRLVAKLDFAGWAEFQSACKAEIVARLSPPRDRVPDAPAGAGRVAQVLDRLAHSVGEIREHLDETGGARVAALLADAARPVWITGGRFSGMVAGHLAAHLRLMRPGVVAVDASSLARTTALLDLGADGVVVVFDYRRYQDDTVAFGRAAAAQGATVVLFTDEYASPLAATADLVVTTSVDAPTPFDALTPAVAVVEALIADVVDRLGTGLHERLDRWDTVDRELSPDRRTA
jgi:DNA-binding MurR/RpiR family transcriptional regulator